ncbi:MAG: thioredoxin domain-containing protein [Bacteroidia bacterium]
MKYVRLFSIAAILFLAACSESAAPQKLDAKSFAKQVENTSDGRLILDVRTSTEFMEGHIKGAQNIDWNGNNFEAQTASLNKNNPVYVYCLAGGRSAEAATFLREKGFSNVLELDGGMRAWSIANLPLEKTETNTPTDLPPAQLQMGTAGFSKLANEKQLTLFDFSATWCGPCKILSPRLDEIASEMGSQIRIVKIDVDAEPALADSMNITSIPVLLMYKEGKVVWRNVGLIDKADIVSAITENK